MHYHTVYIGVNYKTPEKALSWVDSIFETNGSSLIVVVDNSKNDNPHLEKAVGGGRKALYIDSGGNLGYFNAAAFALEKIKQQNTFDWVAVSNVDLCLQTSNVDDILDNYENAGVVAPSIISFDTGNDKNPYRINRASKKALIIKRVAFSNRFFFKVYSILSDIRNRSIMHKKKKLEAIKYSDSFPIYLPYGAVLFFSNHFFKKGCELNFPLFLFGEELFVAEQARRAGLEIVYVPAIRFLNYEHASTSKLNVDLIRECNHKAMKFILEKYY